MISELVKIVKIKKEASNTPEPKPTTNGNKTHKKSSKEVSVNSNVKNKIQNNITLNCFKDS